MTSTTRTARCGPACRVVWEGNGQVYLTAPIPIYCIFLPTTNINSIKGVRTLRETIHHAPDFIHVAGKN